MTSSAMVPGSIIQRFPLWWGPCFAWFPLAGSRLIHTHSLTHSPIPIAGWASDTESLRLYFIWHGPGVSAASRGVCWRLQVATCLMVLFFPTGEKILPICCCAFLDGLEQFPFWRWWLLQHPRVGCVAASNIRGQAGLWHRAGETRQRHLEP